MSGDYVKRLRARIGHELLLLPSVAVLVRDDSGRLLLVRSSDFAQWQTVGGAIEVGESPAAAAKREAREEIGVDVVITRLIDCVGGPDFRATYPNGDEVAYVSMVYEARIENGVPRPDMDEVTEIAWFADDEIAKIDIDPFNRTLLTAIGVLQP